MFILGIVVIFSIAGFVLKNTILIIVSGLGWSLSSIYMFSLSASGDPDYGAFTNGFGYMCILMAMACFFSSWWIHRKRTIEIVASGNFYETQFKDEFKDMKDIYEARDEIKRMRKGRGR
jgi:hypothetical protein